MVDYPKKLLNGNEAVAHAALAAGVHLGCGYPGTPSTEILETLAAIGGKAQWAPNEKVALEVAIGVAFGKGRALATMKHVGLNVAADPLFTAAHTGVSGGLVILVADDPGMASSQNEQDSRRYAVAAGIPMMEPSDSQEAYDFFGGAMALSETWNTPVLLRLTTRICHSKTIVELHDIAPSPNTPDFQRDIPGRVMVPAYARPAHRRMRERLAKLAQWNETSEFNPVREGSSDLGIITSGISAVHAREAAPEASLLKLEVTYPLPLAKMKAFAHSVKRCVVIEEGDPVLHDACLAHGICVEGKDEMYRFGELNVTRVRRILAGDNSAEPVPVRGKPPQLCPGCPHRMSFETLRDLECIVAGDIGCYTLGVLPPFEAMDTCVCMGAAIGVGLGLRHVLPEEQARRVVSVIGDSTFVHSGITGIAEMMYNPPPGGHVVMILDNSTTAMTGMQEHPGTGLTLDHRPTHQLDFEALCRAMGVPDVTVFDAHGKKSELHALVQQKLAAQTLCVILVKKVCILAAKKTHATKTSQAKG